MTAQRTIKAAEILYDIYSGMSRRDLMQKYGLSRKQLRSALEQLVDAGALAREEVTEPISSDIEAPEIPDMRTAPRIRLDNQLEIFALDRPEVKGRVSNISETGLGVRGIAALVDETKNLVMIWQDDSGIRTIEVEARCRWVEQMGGMNDYVAGFQITKVSGRNLSTFRQFFQMIPFEQPENSRETQ